MMLLSEAFRTEPAIKIVVSGAQGGKGSPGDPGNDGAPGAPGTNGGVGSSAGYGGLFTAASGMAVGAGITRVKLSGYSVAGIGGGDYVYDAAVDSAYVTAQPRAAFLAADGRGFRLDVTDGCNVQQFGAIANNSTDAYPAIVAALAYLAALDPTSSALDKANGVIRFPAGKYYCVTTINLKQIVTLKGSGTGQAASSSTIIRFPPGIAGIVVNTQHTLGYGLALNTTSGAGSIIEGLCLLGGPAGQFGGGAAYDDTAEADGILMRGRAVIRDCQVIGFQRDGISIQAGSDYNPILGNANNWVVERCSLQWNGRHGLFVTGSDANAGYAQMLDLSFNRRWGILEASFLGNTYVGCHADSNAVGDGVSIVDSVVSYPSGGQRYAVAYGQEAAAATTVPGTNAAIWIPVGATGGRPWASGIIVRSGGPYAMRSTSQLLGCYSEGGQGPSQNVSPAISLGGLHGAGIAGTGIHLGGDTGRLSTAKGYVVNYPNGHQVSLGGEASENYVLQSAVAGKVILNFRYEGPDYNWYYGGTSIQRVTWEGTTLSFGRGIAQPGKFLFPEIFLGNNNEARPLTFATSPPSSGAHASGEVIFNNDPVAGGKVGWICTTAGTPGTWKAFGAIDA